MKLLQVALLCLCDFGGGSRSSSPKCGWRRKSNQYSRPPRPIERWFTEASPEGRGGAWTFDTFRAELAKLKTVIADLQHSPPILFLLDDLLRGTNSRARAIGARAVIAHLTVRARPGWWRRMTTPSAPSIDPRLHQEAYPIERPLGTTREDLLPHVKAPRRSDVLAAKRRSKNALRSHFADAGPGAPGAAASRRVSSAATA